MKRCIGGFKMAETVFVDTTFLVARFNTRDRTHRHAVDFLESQRRSPGAPRPVLSDYVFDEMVTTLLFRSRRHAVARAAGKAILESQASRIVRVDDSASQAAWDLFLAREDKDWSFTDCTSLRSDGPPRPADRALVRSELSSGGLRDPPRDP